MVSKDKEILRQRLKDFLNNRQVAYKQAFDLESQAVKAVLKDMAKFCRAEETCFHEDQRVHAVLEGRREVYLRIMNHIKLSPDELWTIYGGEK